MPCSSPRALPRPSRLRAAGRLRAQHRLGLLRRAHINAGEFRYVGKETDRKWEEGGEISVLEFKATEFGRAKKVVATEEIKECIVNIGINECARRSGFDSKNFIRKLVRGQSVKRSTYDKFVRWLEIYKEQGGVLRQLT
jgi:hypothetical protein